MVTDNRLAAEVTADIRAFIAQQRELMFNELDFQIQLAMYLRSTGHYDDVDVEYTLPCKMVPDYNWPNNLRIDLVVSRGGRFCPVELKYPTRKVVKPISRFGENVSVVVMKNQGAQDIVRYNFWKDVRRMECLCRRFAGIDGAVAVMMTNDPSYTRPVRPASACAPFSTAADHTVGPGTVDWLGTPAVREKLKPFSLDGSYTVQWQAAVIDDIEFNYTIITI